MSLFSTATLRVLATVSVAALVFALGGLIWVLTAPLSEPDVTAPTPEARMERVKPAAQSASVRPEPSAPPAAAAPAPPVPVPAPAAVSTEELRAALTSPNVVPGEVLLIFRNAGELAAFRARAALYGMRILSADARLRAARVAWTDLGKLARELSEHSSAYQEAAPNPIFRLPGMPAPEPVPDANNAGGTAPFGESMLASIGATGDRSTWGSSVKVAVLDSGIQAHPALEGVRIERIDLIPGESAKSGHGTAMASLIAGQRAPAEGVAPAVNLLDIRLANDSGQSNAGLVATGIMTAVDRGAQVINVSLGGFGDSTLLAEAVGYAQSRGVIIVAAAGNERRSGLAIPAAFPGVISVAAADAERTQASFSNSGAGLTLAAPGVGVVSAYSEGRWVIGSGTSQAAAITTGAVAALLGRGHPASSIPARLSSSALKTGAPAEQVGAGFLQMPSP